ncbi:MAG: hypothetical protein GX859_06450 [Corynebacterium humireducens]|jgi:hypothetical protein|uniref:Uncharacterized protein n=1 Tax=Corynebacterium humireducens TaxID=1223514 RepID=A0A7X6PPL7_9CORY|nr:hypothetical protein [Corynebacterium humireducens]
MNRPLRRTRGDLIATGVITAVSVAAVSGVWLTSPVRSSHLNSAEVEHVAAEPLEEVPGALVEAWSLPDVPLPGVHQPVISDGLVMTNNGHRVFAVDPSPTGGVVWDYERDLELCSLGAAWGRVVTTWRADHGCGDVVSIDTSTGRYERTRSAISPDDVVAVASNDRIGTVGADRLELWRSDMVRTVEYGHVEGRQEPNLQPHPGCELTSALTRTELLAVTEVCNDGVWLRFQEATPEESRTPEIRTSVQLSDAGAFLVAVGEEGAAVVTEGAVVSYSDEGVELHRHERGAPLPTAAEGLPHAPVAADLPHHLTWFDGGSLLLFSPGDLEVQHEIPALGTGVAVGERLLVPVPEGISVVDWTTGETERTIPVDRGGYEGMVTLGVAGGTVVEKRGDLVVGLVPEV